MKLVAHKLISILINPPRPLFGISPVADVTCESVLFTEAKHLKTAVMKYPLNKLTAQLRYNRDNTMIKITPDSVPFLFLS